MCFIGFDDEFVNKIIEGRRRKMLLCIRVVGESLLEGVGFVGFWRKDKMSKVREREVLGWKVIFEVLWDLKRGYKDLFLDFNGLLFFWSSVIWLIWLFKKGFRVWIGIYRFCMVFLVWEWRGRMVIDFLGGFWYRVS